jgi:hypothetical protein
VQTLLPFARSCINPGDMVLFSEGKIRDRARVDKEREHDGYAYGQSQSLRAQAIMRRSLDRGKSAAYLCAILSGILLVSGIVQWAMKKGSLSSTAAVCLDELPQEIKGYTVDGDTFTIAVCDPEIVFLDVNRRIDTVTVYFSRPLTQNIGIRLRYNTEESEVLAGKKTVVCAARRGAVSACLPVYDDGTSLYLSIGTEPGQNFAIDRIVLNEGLPSPQEMNRAAALVVGEALLFLTSLLAALGILPGKNLPRPRNPSEAKLQRKERIYLFCCFLMAFVWSAVFIFERYGPDEYMRYDVPLFIFYNGKLPFGWEESIINQYWGFSYGFGTYAPDLLSAFFMRAASLFTTNAVSLLVAARFTGVLSLVGIGYYAIRISRELFKSPIRWVFIALMTLTPQIVFLSSYVNRDSFSLFTVMLLLFAWIQGLRTGWDMKSCLRLAVGAALCLLSYEYAYGYVLCSFVIYCLWYVNHRKTVSFRQFILKGLLVLGVALLICGWVYVRNGIIYKGDILARSTMLSYGEKYAREDLRPSVRRVNSYFGQGHSILYMLKNTGWLKMTFKSFFSVLGYMDIYAGRWVYAVYTLLTCVGAAGVVVLGFGFGEKAFRRGKSEGRLPFSNRDDFLLLISMLLAAALFSVGLSVYYSWSSDYQPQGRYIISAAPFLYFAVTVGLDAGMRGLSATMGRQNTAWFRFTSLGVFLLAFSTMAEAFVHCLRVFVY